jgi:hypothetical protein
MKNFYVVKGIFAKLLIVIAIANFLYACHADSRDAKPRTVINKDVSTATTSNTSSLSNSTNADKSYSAQMPANTKSKFEAATGLTLPDKTKVLFYESAEGSDQIVKVIVEMTASAFKAWIANYYLDASHFTEEKRYLLGANVSEWQPQTPKNLPTAQVQFENAKTLNIGYENQTLENVKIFLIFHGS